MSFNFRIENRIIDVQTTKLIRCAYLTNNLNESILDSLRYFIYDLFYVRENKNYTKFEGEFTKVTRLEPNSTYLFSVLGSSNSTPLIGPFLGTIQDREKSEEIYLRIGDVLEINTENECTFIPEHSLLTLGFKVTKSNNLEDTPNIRFFRQLISKPSWANHFPLMSD